MDGIVSNYVTISIAPEGQPCEDPTGMPAADLALAMNAGTARIANILLQAGRTLRDTPQGLAEVTSEIASAEFYRRGSIEILSGLGIRKGISTPAGTCTVYALPATEGVEIAPGVRYSNWLDAGPTVNLTSPLAAKPLIPNGVGAYGYKDESVVPGAGSPVFLVPGQYTVSNAPGGSDVGAFQTSREISDPVNWTNRDSLGKVNRSQDLTVTWDGGSDATEVVLVFGYSKSRAGESAASFICAQQPSAGGFTVPSSVLRSLPASLSGPADGAPTAILGVGTQPLTQSGRFGATGIDVGFFLYFNWTARDVTVQ